MTQHGWTDEASPFHEGEQEIQTRLGRRDEMERFGRRVIRPFLPEQHREFYAQLPYVAVGAVDADGRPWASLAFGEPGFLASPDPRSLRLETRFHPGDPVAGALDAGAPVGLLGIELSTRRRNRVNGRVSDRKGDVRGITVDQSFGNCPQYIQTRALDPAPRLPSTPPDAEPDTRFSETDRALIASADTFFVASATPARASAREGVDVSHRGGRPGFVRIDGKTLTIPDYTGNFHFNTLGNFLINPRAGLAFVDFATGDMLLMTGRVEILWDTSDFEHFKGAERAWRFELDRLIRLPAAAPLRWRLDEVSPNSTLTGTWTEAAALAEAERSREQWRAFEVSRIEDESEVIRSFHLRPADGGVLHDYEAGQFLPIRIPGGDGHLMRTYTLSSAPGDAEYRISVKREHGVDGRPDGRVSTWLHTQIKPGDRIDAKAPRGGFTLDAADERPAVLIGAGVGITPMIAMARHVAIEGFRTRRMRPVTVIQAARSASQRAFAQAFRDLEAGTQGMVRYVPVISDAGDSEKGDRTGTVDGDLLQSVLGFADHEFFLCGPPPFMQAMYDLLREFGVADDRIRAEAFGPAALKRTSPAAPDEPLAAEDAHIRFARSDVEQRWERVDGTLLDFAEAHGLQPEFSCRSGACGSCAVKLLRGELTYPNTPTAAVGDGQALLCSAVPAPGSETIELDL